MERMCSPSSSMRSPHMLHTDCRSGSGSGSRPCGAGP
jgi:hypothetical protein